MEQEQTFFDFAAEVGLTKHIGGVGATGELAGLCHIDPGRRVLDVGCGAGATPCYLVKRYGCRVTAVDIRPAMVDRAAARARKEGLAGQIELRVADAQDLPFDGDLFDAVITESVTAFPEDKQRAVAEYARVTRPGGYVGLNETTWLKTPVPPEVVDWAAQDVGASVKPLTAGEWRALLEGAGLAEIAVKVLPVDVRQEAKGLVARYGAGGTVGILWRMLRLYARSPAYRRFAKEVGRRGIVPKDLADYFGYGLFVGKK